MNNISSASHFQEARRNDLLSKLTIGHLQYFDLLSKLTIGHLQYFDLLLKLTIGHLQYFVYSTSRDCSNVRVSPLFEMKKSKFVKLSRSHSDSTSSIPVHISDLY